MKHVLTVFFSFVLIAASSFSSGHQAQAWIADERGASEWGTTIKKICADPNYVFIDLSRLGLTDEELKIVSEGLLERQRVLPGGLQTLSFIKITSPAITEDGLRAFLRSIQEGINREGSSLRPDMRKVIMQVGIPLTDEVYDRLLAETPRLLTTGNLTLIEGS